MCTSSCPTQDHANWGECARAKNLVIASVDFDRHEDRDWSNNLDAYKTLRKQGVQPRGTSAQDVLEATVISETSGKAVDFASDSLGL